MEIDEVLRRFESMLSRGMVNEAGRYLEDMAAKSESAGDRLTAASCFNELTGFWRVCGREEKSCAAAERALALLAESGCGDGIDYATAMLNYATAKAAFTRIPEALRLYRRVEARYRELLPAVDYRWASLYNNMAQALLKSGNRKEAADCFEKSLRLLEQMEGVDSETATCNTNIAFCLLAENRKSEAGERLERAEAIFRSLPGDPHYDSVLSCRGQLQYMEGQYAESAECYRRLAENIEKRFGRNLNYATACRNCAKACAAAGLGAEAERYRRLAESAGRHENEGG